MEVQPGARRRGEPRSSCRRGADANGSPSWPALISSQGGTAVPLRVDMADAEDIIGAVGRAEEAVGTVTIVVNNAGIPDAQRAHKMSIELIDQFLDTNVRGPYILSCELARRPIVVELPGRIVNISSIGAYHYTGSGAALMISKAVAYVQQTLEVLDRNGKLLEQLEKIADARYRVGEGSQQDILKSQLERTKLLREGRSSSRTDEFAAGALRKLLNRPPGSPDISTEPLVETPLVYTSDELLAKVRTENPEVPSQQETVKKQSLQVEIARKDRYPDFSLHTCGSTRPSCSATTTC